MLSFKDMVHWRAGTHKREKHSRRSRDFAFFAYAAEANQTSNVPEVGEQFQNGIEYKLTR